MYCNFFALSELPFSISPDPKYLYMSDRHKEALAHLTYGLGDTGGFALLTGEVGTGKTTVSRCLMEQLPENTQTAFILNPTLSSKELLATICDQLKISYKKSAATLKTLTDKISDKLLKNHANEINTLLIIDEAQHLEAQVLEQLRLLTNLETNTKKLLQVILIGQPELQQLLQRRDLRQLAQRITARYHLLPLTKVELAQYIAHRLSVAQCQRKLFNPGAMAKIHQLTQGIPRLVNLLCHRALLDAFNQNESLVTKKTVVQAAVFALGDEYSAIQNNNNAMGYVGLAASILSVVLLGGFWWGQSTVEFEHTVRHGLTDNVVTASNSTPQAHLAARKTLEKVQQSTTETTSVNEHSPVDEAVLPKAKLNSEVGQKMPLPQQNKSALLQVKENVALQETVRTMTVASATTEQTPSQDEIAFNVKEVEGVSHELVALFKQAITDTAREPHDSLNAAINKPGLAKQATRQIIKPLSQMPMWVQTAIPNLHFEQHIYASDGQGWVTVNGRDRYQGDMITDELRVDDILAKKVILSYRGETFSLPAITNWYKKQ